MIHTIEELIIVINNYEIKIRQYEVNLACFYQNYDERKRLEQKKKVLKKQIEHYIQEFKEKTKNNHLESRLYTNRLAVLEKKFQIQPRIMSANLFCLNVLKSPPKLHIFFYLCAIKTASCNFNFTKFD